MKVLLVEDDSEMALYVMEGLGEQGVAVDRAADGPAGLASARGGDYDVVVMDRLLPGIDGLSIVKTLRRDEVRTPVLYLTTMDGLDDRVEGLEAGGDDYLVKPFHLAELHARLKALARRPPETRTHLRVGEIEIDLLKRSARRAGKAVALLPQEFKLLEYLMRNAGRVVTRTMMLENVWNIHFDPQTSVVESHISRLRAKINAGFDAEYIRTIRGSGYSLRVPD